MAQRVLVTVSNRRAKLQRIERLLTKRRGGDAFVVITGAASEDLIRVVQQRHDDAGLDPLVIVISYFGDDPPKACIRRNHPAVLEGLDVEVTP